MRQYDNEAVQILKKLMLTVVTVGACTLNPAWTLGIAHADNGCGWDEAYLCEEADYLNLVAHDGIKGDPASLLKAGYASCVMAKPGSETGPLDREAGRRAVLATGVVASLQDAEKIVTEAAHDLC